MLDDITARPYFLRAFYNWCVDVKRTPYLLAAWDADKNPKVPAHLSNAGKIIFNISPAAVRSLTIDKDGVFFTARFLGNTVGVAVPLLDVLAAYAQETGEGLSFAASSAKPKPKPKVVKTPPQNLSRAELAKRRRTADEPPALRII